MKKFTSILMLFLACVGTAWAQAPQGGQTEALKKHDTSTWTITGNSEINEGSGGGLMTHATDGRTDTYWHSNWSNDKTAPHWILIDTKTAVDIKQIDYTPRQNNINGAWFHCKVYASDTNFNITTPSNNKTEKDKVLALTNPVADVTVCASNANNNTKQSKKHIKLNTTKAYQYYLIAITESQGDNVGNHATAAEIEFFTGNTATVTYKYVLDNVVKKSITRNELIGSPYTAPEDIPFVREDFQQGSVVSGTNEVTITCTEELPFVKTTDANEKCYAINIKPASKPYFWQYTADNTNLTISAKGYDANGLSTMDESFLWYFKGNVFDGFEIYNKKAGATKTLSSGNGDPKVATETTKTKWFLHTADNGFAFKASNTNYINFHEHTNTLSYWDYTDGGSSCRFFKPADFVLQQSISLKNAPANAVGGKVGAEKLDNATVSANHFDFAAAKTLATAITQLKDNAPLTSGGYYRIVSAVPAFMQNQHVHKAFYLDEASKFIKWKTLSNSEVGQVFQIVESNTQGKYKIKNCNAKQFMQGPRGGLNDAGADVTLAKLDLTQYNIKFGDQMCHAESHGNGSGQSGALIPYAAGLNSASAWYIVNADDIEVALHNGADKNGATAAYGTAYLPFAVSQVASQDGSVKMYTGEYKNTYIALTEATASVGVAAEQAILLKGNKDATKATLTIGNGTAQSTGMTGTLTQIAKPTTGTVLTLGRSKTAPNAVGFYVFDGQNLRANSAYIHVTNQAATGLSLVFDGEVTDIESVETADKADNQPLFDLTGRRVMQTVKGGIYIKANGEKYIAR